MSIRTDRLILSMILASVMGACAAIVGIEDFPEGTEGNEVGGQGPVGDGDIDGVTLNGCDPQSDEMALCSPDDTAGQIVISAESINPPCCIGNVNKTIHFSQKNQPGNCILRGGVIDDGYANIDENGPIEKWYHDQDAQPYPAAIVPIYVPDANVPFFCEDSGSRGAIIVR